MSLPAQHELLLQIIEHPDDDRRRLVLADRLMEAADPLGELITVQIALEGLSGDDVAGDWHELKLRERELLERNGARWRTLFAPFAWNLVFRRGLPHTVICPADALVEDQGLTVPAPIEHLRLNSLVRDGWLGLPLLKRVRAITLIIYERHSSSLELPANVKKLRLVLAYGIQLESMAVSGLLRHVEELEVEIELFTARLPSVLLPPHAPALKRVSFIGEPTGGFRAEWQAELDELSAARPELVICWGEVDDDEFELFAAGEIAVEVNAGDLVDHDGPFTWVEMQRAYVASAYPERRPAARGADRPGAPVTCPRCRHAMTPGSRCSTCAAIDDERVRARERPLLVTALSAPGAQAHPRWRVALALALMISGVAGVLAGVASFIAELAGWWAPSIAGFGILVPWFPMMWATMGWALYAPPRPRLPRAPQQEASVITVLAGLLFIGVLELACGIGLVVSLVPPRRLVPVLVLLVLFGGTTAGLVVVVRDLVRRVTRRFRQR